MDSKGLPIVVEYIGSKDKRSTVELDQARELLESMTFGTVAAERDTNLVDWFVSTLAFKRVISGDISLVLGAKGTGKTAIYRVLVENQGFIEGLEEDIVIPTTDIQGISDFHQVLNVGQGEPDNYRQLWKLYFALLLGKTLLAESQVSDIDVSRLRGLLRNAGLLPPSAVSRVGQWLAGIISSVKVGIVYQTIPVSLGIDLQGNAALSQEPLDVWEVLSEAQSVLSSDSRKAWILVDRLDELFSGTLNARERRERALVGLMVALLDFEEFSNIKLVFFLRSDIYDRLSFVNKDHLSDRNLEIDWDLNDLKLLIVRRAASSDMVQVLSQTEGADSRIGVSEAEAVLKTLLESGRQDIPSAKIEGIAKILRNSREQVTPRDVIYLFSAAQRLQLEDIEQGIFSPSSPLLPVETFKEAFKIVSKDKIADFVLGEFPEVEGIIRQLEGQNRSTFSRTALQNMFGIVTDKSVDEVLATLHEIGVLRPLGTSFIQRARKFEIPLLYRPALGLPHSAELAQLLS